MPRISAAIALHSDGTLDASKYWFNVDKFERDPAKTPTSFQTRAFPFQIDGLRGPGLMYLNLNITRKFGLGEQRSLQARFDIQNVLNYAAFGNPNTDPTKYEFRKGNDGRCCCRGHALLQLRYEVQLLITVGAVYDRPQYRN